MHFFPEYYLCGEFRNHLTKSDGRAVRLYKTSVQLLLLKNNSATTVTSLITFNPFDLDTILLNCMCHLLPVSNILQLLDSPLHMQQVALQRKLHGCNLCTFFLLKSDSVQQHSA